MFFSVFFRSPNRSNREDTFLSGATEANKTWPSPMRVSEIGYFVLHSRNELHADVKHDAADPGR